MILDKLKAPAVRPAYFILLLGLFLVLLPQFSHIPLWLSLVTVTLILWRGCYDLQLCPIPGKKIVFLFTLMLMVGIIFSYRTLLGRNADSAMLLGLLCLKLFEIHSFRDIAVIINLALFSIVINFLFNQSIPVALIMLIALVFLLAALIGFQHDYKKLNKIQPFPIELIQSSEKQHFKLASKMLIQAMPFAIVLFIFFPRVDGPLWGLPEDAFSGRTGLSDQMSPGRISQLSNNSAVAFRVKFDTAVPAADKRYWRGPVMWHFDGYNWTAPAKDRVAIRKFKFTALNELTRYSIILQPHNNFWMFALDIPATLPANSLFSTDIQLLSKLPVQKLQRYEVTSYTQYHLPANPDISMHRYLTLPDNSSPRSRILIQQLKVNNNPQATVNNILNYFATQDFYYSRNPPLLFDEPVDDFLFDSKRGYCEHYASSFTVLMRLAGIPARVVTGYQGGEINPLDQFMTLRQSDAHAWSEIYLENTGWIRIDPTAAIPPGNIENTADALRLNSSQDKPSRLFQTSWLTKSFKQARFAWDAVNNRWNQWILGYNNKRQKAFFAALGIPEISWQGLSQLLFSILAVLSGLLAILVFSKQKQKKDMVLHYYLKFLKKLDKTGLIKKPAEGANDYAIRVIERYPDEASKINTITHLYHQLRYAVANEQMLKHYIKQISLFRSP